MGLASEREQAVTRGAVLIQRQQVGIGRSPVSLCWPLALTLTCHNPKSWTHYMISG